MIYYDPYHPETNAKTLEEWVVACANAEASGHVAYCVETCTDVEWIEISKSLGLG